MKICDDGENNPDDYITAVFMLWLLQFSRDLCGNNDEHEKLQPWAYNN